MAEYVSPRQVARAIGVSESAVKRWCDRGLVPVVRTAGRHRRIPLSGVISYLRASGHSLVRPELLGLPPATSAGPAVLERAVAPLLAAVREHDEECVRRIIVDLHLSAHSVAEIGDAVLAPAFEQVGELWERGEMDVYQERHACDMCHRALQALTGLLDAPRPDAPAAIGGGISGDPYTLATRLVELVLRQAGWRAMSLGHDLPPETIEKAIEHHRPRLVWLSVSAPLPEEQLRRSCESLAARAGRHSGALVVGGRESAAADGSGGSRLGSLRELEALAAAATQAADGSQYFGIAGSTTSAQA